MYSWYWLFTCSYCLSITACIRIEIKHLLVHVHVHYTIGKVYSLEGVMVVTARQGFKPAQVTLKRTLLEHSKKKGFATNFTEFKVHYMHS